MQISSEKLGNEVDILKRRDEDIAQRDDLWRSRLVAKFPQRFYDRSRGTNVFMPQVLEKLQLTVCTLGENRCAEGLHDLLDGDILVGELVFRGAARQISLARCVWRYIEMAGQNVPDETKSSHTNGLEIRVPIAGSDYERIKENGSSREGQPRGDLKGSSEDLGADEFGHCDVWCFMTWRCRVCGLQNKGWREDCRKTK